MNDIASSQVEHGQKSVEAQFVKYRKMGDNLQHLKI